MSNAIDWVAALLRRALKGGDVGAAVADEAVA
jgi:hypothetical protein